LQNNFTEIPICIVLAYTEAKPIKTKNQMKSFTSRLLRNELTSTDAAITFLGLISSSFLIIKLVEATII
jgi:hypothetical protein